MSIVSVKWGAAAFVQGRGYEGETTCLTTKYQSGPAPIGDSMSMTGLTVPGAWRLMTGDWRSGGRKMPRSSKGSEFERWLCKELSLWWTGGESDSVFWRTSNSGGRATVRAAKGKKTKNHYGDIMAVDPVGQPLLDLITFEVKRGYSRDTIADLLDKPPKAAKQTYEKWVEQAERSAEHAGTPYWMIVTKRDKRVPLLFTDRGLSDLLCNQSPESYPTFFSVIGWGERDVFATPLDFLFGVRPEAVKLLAREKVRC